MFGKKSEIAAQQSVPQKHDKKVDTVVLKTLCIELKLDPREARERLRVAARDSKKYPELAKSRRAGAAWEWPKSSQALTEAKAALA